MTVKTEPALAPADLHEDQVVALLRSGAHAALLSAYFGETEYRELSHLAKLAATRRRRGGLPVFILPGIMGTRLGLRRKQAHQLVWLHPSAIEQGAMRALAWPGSRALGPIGVMLPGYLKMKLTLEIAGFQPTFFPFDWRADVERSARALTKAIYSLRQRRVSVLAHSMGGLVARMALRYDKAKRIRSLIQLGAPNAGSFAPVQALRAVYPTVRKIAALDRRHSAEDLARHVFRTLPGVHQLLPRAGEPDEIDLLQRRNWPRDALRPNADLLERSAALHRKLPSADERCSVFVGVSQPTITRVEKQGEQFVYTYSVSGDGTVPIDRATWAHARTWYIPENHGALSTNANVLAAIVDVLRTGETKRYPTHAPLGQDNILKTMSDDELRRCAIRKLDWDELSIDSRRRILEPVFTEEFLQGA